MMDAIEKGIKIIKKSLEVCPRTYGVYLFKLNDKILYVGKAKNLFNRLKSYINFDSQSRRIKKMITTFNEIKYVRTHSEADALILENNLIKKYKPTFNVRLIDDKSFPYILISKKDKWPRLQSYRGDKKIDGFYFGPFPSPSAVRETISLLEKGFLMRTCTDSYFKNRSRPCMLYQIKRCSAPCVNLVSNIEYEKLTKDTISFLEGNDSKVKDKLIKKMQILSKNENFEDAAKIRDRIKAINRINQHSFSRINYKGNFDIVCFQSKFEEIFIEIVFFRNGSNLGNKEYVIKNYEKKEFNSIIKDFLIRFYLKHHPPKNIIFNKKVDDLEALKAAFKKEKDIVVEFSLAKKGIKKDLVDNTEKNLNDFAERHYHNIKTNKQTLSDLKDIFQLPKIPKRIEIYDNSHLGGNNPVGAMVVYENYKFNTSEYRKFNIRSITKTHDDYFMMQQVLSRRFQKQNNNSWKKNYPDLVLIDGGKGHLKIAEKTITKKNIEIISIAKGKKRNAGEETIFYKNKLFKLEKRNKVLFFLQNLRDEAHRFAISSQRYRRIKQIKDSLFDEISGIGGKIKKSLLSHFGSIDNIKSASLKDLKKVPGIGKIMANKIYNQFN